MPDSVTAQVLQNLLGKISPALVLNRFYTLQRFIQYIIEYRVDEHIIITIIERPKEFIALHSLFENTDASNLIIICDDTKEMIELAHELRPRFLAHSNETLQVIAVVEKMLQLHKNIKGETL
jgi:hypothetical protein